ncbi:endo-beta-1,3-glucanase [Cordyceps fumosorosea ARSEF 2679]|uniref:glucan endo-1,3-beta-D-glucosidase n=1 Tax=Cordyceps fumosorosea (strain ARSEF 2679) TaxID=1081104 RepID=A0A162ICD3_CORFA|nr:endo-beta-1,3-glucanase [Cordyceps fumosorosea ARSEF 2679]OAA55105.1 endo-beta-1,3-glucanase [Cordyceps fumosorosea ARSEF 2679]
MQHYSNNDPYEREPLDPAYDNRYRTPSRRPQYNEYAQESPYHDDSPGRTPEPAAHYDQRAYDNVPVHQQGPPPPPHMNLHPHDGPASRQHADDYHRSPPSDSSGPDNYGYAHPAAMSAGAYNPDSLRTAGQVLPPPSRANAPNSSSPHPSLHSGPYAAGYAMDGDSRSTVNPFGTVAGSSVGSRSPSRSPNVSTDHYLGGQEAYYNHSASSRLDAPSLGVVDPMSIADDGDDGLHYGRQSNRNSAHSGSKRAVPGAIGAAAGGATAVAAEHANPLDTRGFYEPAKRERSSDWLEKKQGRSKKWKWAIIVLIFLVIVGAIVGGVVGTLVAGRKDDSKDKSGSGTNDDASGDLGLKSAEIQKLLNNKNLHKVFPGMDYTPINVQYPDCLKNPPSQNNVTRDVAVLSQLTNKIRLYGTDCNQTQMVLHAIDRLEMKKDIKVWLGVWQDGNSTTNQRQLSQMWDILDQYGGDQFEGVIVANEILFRKEMTITQLSSVLTDVRANLTKRSISLPVATSDLGDDWTTELGADSDLIMANIHPFFSGTPADLAAGWTYSFWENKNGPMWKPDKKKNVISETGWPSGGGTRCPTSAPQCTTPAKAGIDEMNRFMADWVCDALKNGTNYFWFEAFDEPWKSRFNSGNENWEDKWGLLDVNRNLKSGIKIPDCGGTTVS